MYDPNYVVASQQQPHTLESEGFYPLPLRINQIDSNKEYNKIVKNIEITLRRSYEYKIWRGYVVDTCGHNICAISGEVSDEVTIEIHHHPFRLFDLVRIVVDEYIINGKGFCTFDIATEVIELHYNNDIGYIPLCTTLHEKHHNGYLDIDINLVSGNYKNIFKLYSHIDGSIIEKVTNLMNIKQTSQIEGLVKDTSYAISSS